MPAEPRRVPAASSWRRAAGRNQRNQDPPTPFIGRRRELDPTGRLLTITGVGGTGKTRLHRAVQAGSAMSMAEAVAYALGEAE